MAHGVKCSEDQVKRVLRRLAKGRAIIVPSRESGGVPLTSREVAQRLIRERRERTR